MTSNHITSHRNGFAFGTTTITTHDEDHGVELSIVRQRKGETFEDTSTMETAWVLLNGDALTSVDGIEHVFARHSLFDERPSVVQLPAGARIALHAHSDVEWARGQGLVQDASLRVVRLVFDDTNAPASNLVIGEVVNLPGRWSSYPPHHHDQPELYHYRFTHPQGYGDAEIGDEVLKVKHNDTVKIMGGVDHPQVAAPGYGMYYLWIVRHAATRYTGFTFTNEQRWILDGEQGWIPKELK